MRFWLSHTRIGHVYKNCSHCHRTSCLECWDVCINLLDVVLWVVEVGSGEQWWVCKYKVKLHTEQCNTSVLWHSELSWTELFPHTDTSARLSQEHLNYAEWLLQTRHYHRYNGQILGAWTAQHSQQSGQTLSVSSQWLRILIFFILIKFFLKSQTGTFVAWLGKAIFQARLYFG